MVYNITPITSPKQYDCGATALQMLLNYYGINASLEELVSGCNISIGGCTIGDIQRCGDNYGLECHIWQEIQQENPLDLSIFDSDRPAIIWWKYNHYCVYCGIDDDGKVVICNPDLGRYRMSKDTFRCFYTNIYLTNGDQEKDEETR